MSAFNGGFASPAGVLFVEDFDEEPERARENLPPGPPTFTAQDVEDAREEGRLAGAEEAHADQDAVQAALRNAALTAIGDALDSARADVTAIAEHRAGEIAGAVLALLGAALPATAARLAPREVAALLAALLPPLAQTPGVQLRLHPAVLHGVSGQLAAFPAIAVQADETLSPCDVALSWQDGQALRNWAELWAQLSAALAPFELPAALAQETGG